MTLPCYRSPDNGVRFVRNGHRHDCADPECRGCTPCAERSHCTAKKSCTWHVQAGELTCGRCIGGVRRDLRWIADLAALASVQALNDGVNSEAANLAGPAADYSTFSARRRIAKRWIEAHLPFARWERAYEDLLADDDELHPGVVLKRWEAMLREDYGQQIEGDIGKITIYTALAYLDRNLHRIANDDEQDFGLLRAELRKVRQHLEAVLHNGDQRDRGAPCPTCRPSHRPDCKGEGCRGCLIVRLERQYAHWCKDEACQRFHFTDDASDVWRCPRNHDHWWNPQGYADLLEARKRA